MTTIKLTAAQVVMMSRILNAMSQQVEGGLPTLSGTKLTLSSNAEINSSLLKAVLAQEITAEGRAAGKPEVWINGQLQTRKALEHKLEAAGISLPMSSETRALDIIEDRLAGWENPANDSEYRKIVRDELRLIANRISNN